MTLQRPFPTPVEVIRALANALDSKASNKALDAKAADHYAPYVAFDTFLSDLIPDTLAGRLGSEMAALLTGAARDLVRDYLALVGAVPMDGIPRPDAVHALAEGYFSRHGASVLCKVIGAVGGPSPTALVASADRAVNVVLGWVEQHNGWWPVFLAGCEKEQRDRIAVWRRGGELPSRQSIQRLAEWSPNSGTVQDWRTICTLLLTARAIDYFRRAPLGQVALDSTRILLWAGTVPDFETQAAALQARAARVFAEMLPFIQRLAAGLRRARPKTEEDKLRLRQCLDNAQQRLAAMEGGSELLYWLEWHDARWHIFAGDLKGAAALYRRAFAGALFTAGANQKPIIEEAQVVASSQASPDLVFLKKLKNAAVSFGYETPLSRVPGRSLSARAADVFEDWEVDLWRGHIRAVFPDKGLFPGATIAAEPARIGPLFGPGEAGPQPDLRRPNRRIKVGQTWKKKVPQLIWFVEREDVAAVEQLLQAGADVNAYSESEDTALLMAIQAMNLTDVPYRSLDDTLFQLITKYPHSRETVNRRTMKKRLLPLIVAVESGRLDVVRWLLDQGAEPDGRGQTDERTVLYVCLQYISFVKDPQRFWQVQDAMPATEAMLDSMRRHTRGLAGFTLDHQRQFFNQYRDDAFESVRAKLKELMTKRVRAGMSLAALRAIAELLLEHGADPNTEHASPIPGYTPLMLAAELDELALFDAMVARGGDPTKTYSHPSSGEPVDCRAIAWAFRARSVFERLALL